MSNVKNNTDELELAIRNKYLYYYCFFFFTGIKLGATSNTPFASLFIGIQSVTKLSIRVTKVIPEMFSLDKSIPIPRQCLLGYSLKLNTKLNFVEF